MDIATMYLSLFEIFLDIFISCHYLGLQNIGSKSNKNDKNVNNNKE